MFLKELQKTKIRRLKLKQILLLILRTLIIIFAVLAFSRPTMEGTIPGLETYSKTSAVIIIDNSFSMDVSDEWGNRFKQAGNAAASILDGLKEGDEAAIIPMADIDAQRQYSFSRNFSFLKGSLSKIVVSNTSANLEESLRLASFLIDDAVNINREIYIITDGQKNIFAREPGDSALLFEKKSAIYIIPVGFNAKTEISNLSIDSINAVTRIFQIGKLVEAEARIRNSSAKDAKGVVISLLFNNKRMAQRSVDIPANEIRTLTIAAAPQDKGTFKAALEIEGDAIDRDNRRYFGFLIPERPAVALIGDKTKTNFLSIALNGSSNKKAPAQLSIFTPAEFASIDMSDYDIVICAGGPYRASDLQRLEQYINNGGSAFIFADENTKPDIFSTSMSNLGFGEIEKKEFPLRQPGMFSTVDKLHPVFEGVFRGTTDRKAIVESPKVFHAKPATSGQAIIEMPGGAFLSESRPGEGKVLYCGVSPDNTWSTFPITGLFPTITYRSIIYLSSSEDLGVNIEAGQSCNLPLPKKFASGGNFRILDPNGTEFYKQAVMLPTGAILSFDILKQLGVYSVQSNNGQTVSILSVNPPASESILSTPDKSDFLKAVESRAIEDTHIEFIDRTYNVFDSVLRARVGTELWQFFLLAALLCALAEMIIERNTKAEAEGE